MKANCLNIIEAVAELSACRQGVLEDPGSSPTCHYQLTVYCHCQVDENNLDAVLMNIYEPKF